MAHREGYHGGEFLIKKYEAARTTDFCCICDYRHREGLELYVPGRVFRVGEEIAIVQWAGMTIAWDRAHPTCARQEQERQVHLLAVAEYERTRTEMPVADAPRSLAVLAEVPGYGHRRGRKYQVLWGHDGAWVEFMRYSDHGEANGAVKLLNDYPEWAAQLARHIEGQVPA